MFNKILQTAYESGADILLQLKSCCGEHRGQVLELDEDSFSLFHSGPGGGILWAFRKDDIACCGLVVELPETLSTLSEKLQSEKNQADTDKNLPYPTKKTESEQ